MAVFFKDGCFKIDTENTTYSIKTVDFGFLMHEYYGGKITDTDLGYIYPRTTNRSYITVPYNDTENVFRPLEIGHEYAPFGGGDFRTAALRVKMGDGSRVADLRYHSHEILNTAATIPGMPCAAANGQDGIQTLVITLKDDATELYVKLYYVVFEKFDVIARHTEIINKTNEDIYLEKAASVQLDFLNSDYDFITLSGGWARERHIQRTAIHNGTQGFCARRGTTSHQSSAFFALCEKNTDENHGGVYGCHLVYSGNHRVEAEKGQYNELRIVAGINDESFCWRLRPQESFFTPQALLCYSENGLGGMSRQFHKFIVRHIFKEQWYNSRRPILINNWEATYFDFNEEKLESLANTAAKLGIEMLVMDDGWFGKRSSDKGDLGDWYPNTEKLPGGLVSLASKINAQGLKFGIWMEPEMISEDSDLYRAHPDWVLSVPGRGRSLGRNQYVLDIVNPQVRKYVINAVENVVSSANIEYLKWDMNRYLTEVFTQSLPKENQGEVYHRYVLALYEILDTLTTEFPNLLIEHCSGGGGRFDTGMLYYSPQIWTSDDTDAVERVKIQFGTSLGFPVTCMGSHVSASPNHQTHRETPFNVRADVAFCGTFGYELDITNLTDEERQMIMQQCEFYKENYNLINYGDFYRVEYKENEFAAWCFASPDKKEILLFGVYIMQSPNDPDRFLRIPCADDGLRYCDADDNTTYFGDTLRKLGICLTHLEYGNTTSFHKYFKAE